MVVSLKRADRGVKKRKNTEVKPRRADATARAKCVGVLRQAQDKLCVGEKERVEAALGGGQLAVLFKGEAVYSNDTNNRTYLGVWGARNASRLRRLLREQGVELLVKRTRPPNIRLRSLNVQK